MAITAGILRSVGFLLAIGLVPVPANAQEQSAASAPDRFRVRASNARVRALIDEATGQSATFKALIAAIGATDGIVLIEEGTCHRPVPACLAWMVTLAGRYRILQVLLDSQRPDIELIASIGHELRHALEVLEDPSIRSSGAIRLFYMRLMGGDSPRTFETEVARAAGDAVYREMRRSRGAKQ